jgi:hypothetical protein
MNRSAAAIHGPVSKTRRLGTRIVLVALLVLPGSGLAHTPGLTVADFDVHADGQVEARLTFASAEPLGGLALDRDGDGVVTSEDVSAARDDLRSFVLSGIEVDADGSPCAAAFRDASLTEVDGLVLQASYQCPNDAAEIEATLYYLTPPDRGRSTRRGIARIVAGSEMTEGMLTGERRAIALRLPGRAHAASRKSRRVAVLLAAAAIVALLAWGSHRWRAARAAWQNRTP